VEQGRTSGYHDQVEVNLSNFNACAVRIEIDL
jgi:hypothetical protein